MLSFLNTIQTTTTSQRWPSLSPASRAFVASDQWRRSWASLNVSPQVPQGHQMIWGEESGKLTNMYYFFYDTAKHVRLYLLQWWKVNIYPVWCLFASISGPRIPSSGGLQCSRGAAVQCGGSGSYKPGAEEVLHQNDELWKEVVCRPAQHAGEKSHWRRWGGWGTKRIIRTPNST